MSAGLVAKKALFVEEYLVDLNATQAAIRAGYSEKTAYSQGQRLLKDVEVASAIEKAMSARSARTEITADRVLTELAKIGFSDIRKCVTWKATVTGAGDDDDGADRPTSYNLVQLVDSDVIDDDTAAAVAEISQTAQGGLKIKLHDKKGALVDIGRHLGMFKDKLEHTGADGGPIQVQRIERVIVRPPNRDG